MVGVELCKESAHKLNGCWLFKLKQIPLEANLIPIKEKTKEVLLFEKLEDSYRWIRFEFLINFDQTTLMLFG